MHAGCSAPFLTFSKYPWVKSPQFPEDEEERTERNQQKKDKEEIKKEEARQQKKEEKDRKKEEDRKKEKASKREEEEAWQRVKEQEEQARQRKKEQEEQAPKARGKNKTFDERMEDLTRFKETHGHANVSIPEDKSLAIYCAQVRHASKKE